MYFFHLPRRTQDCPAIKKNDVLFLFLPFNLKTYGFDLVLYVLKLCHRINDFETPQMV